MRRFYVSPRTLWVIISVILLAGSVLTILTPDYELLSIGYELAVVTFMCGMINIWIAVEHWDTMCGSQLLLADGLVTMFISTFLVILEMTSVNLFPITFGMWEIFSGLFKIAESGRLRSHKIHGWHRFLAVGIIEVVSGILILPKEIDDVIGMHGKVAAVLFLQFIGTLFRIVICKHIIVGINEEMTEA